MSTINDGGPAFPVSSPAVEWQPERVTDAGTTPAHWRVVRNIGGMTLRDYFAANVLVGLASNATWLGTNLDASAGYEKAALQAYAYADAMLRARGQQ